MSLCLFFKSPALQKVGQFVQQISLNKAKVFWNTKDVTHRGVVLLNNFIESFKEIFIGFHRTRGPVINTLKFHFSVLARVLLNCWKKNPPPKFLQFFFGGVLQDPLDLGISWNFLPKHKRISHPSTITSTGRKENCHLHISCGSSSFSAFSFFSWSKYRLYNVYIYICYVHIYL